MPASTDAPDASASSAAPQRSDGDAPSLPQRLAWMLVNGLLFQSLYTACHVSAARAGVTRNVAMAWEAGVPFVDWMLLPYMSSVPLLVSAFLWVPDRRALLTLSRRCLLVTSLGTLIFALWPLHIAAERPPSSVPLLGWLAVQLTQLDAPYNQWPSLHVAYCVILWPALASRMSGVFARVALALWLLLVVLSTLFTRQHHLADLAGGAALGALALGLIPSHRSGTSGPGPAVALHYAVASMSSITLGLTLLPLLPCLWLALCCAGVALAYARHDAGFLHKREGGFPLWVWALYAPYLIGYRITWHVVRRCGAPPFEAFADRLWVGRRLDAHEAQALPPGCAVIDLASELSATPTLRGRPGQAFALLDLMPPPAERLAEIADAIDEQLAQGRSVYLHCAMGYRRSREAADAWRARHSTKALP